MPSAPTPTAPAAASVDAAYWVAMAVRAGIAFATGVTVTFLLDHSAATGLLVFGVFGVVGGGLTTWLTARRLGGSRSRGLLIVQGAVTVFAGAASLVLAPGGDTVAWLLLLAVWAAAAGVLELVAGLLARGRSPFSTEWIAVGALTMLLAVVAALTRPEFVVEYGGIENVQGQLTASVLTVGAFGAWAAIVGVYLGIAALSAKWAAAPAKAAS